MNIFLRVKFSVIFSSLLCAGVLLLTANIALANNQTQLNNVQQDIQEQQKKVEQQRKQRNKLQNELRNQEKAISESSRVLRQTKSQLTSLDQEVNLLTPQITQLEKRRQTQQDYLLKQLDNAYRLGKSSGFELMFSSERSQRNERILTYYRYLNEAREEAIVKLKQTTSELNAKKVELLDKQQKQQALLSQQQQQQQKLSQSKTSREKTLKELDISLLKGEQRLAELKQNEQRLQQLIVKAEREAKAQADREAREVQQIRNRQQQVGSNYKPTKEELELMARTSGIGKPQGKLLWPVNGRVTHRFGEPLQGELRWKGMTILAPEGKEVQAVAAGRVLLADWLQGYGLMVIVEHGKGDMSLYGYNQSALVNVGDEVKAGQSIALVGNSGGQGQSALYFEIRREGKALDPQPWLKK